MNGGPWEEYAAPAAHPASAPAGEPPWIKYQSQAAAPAAPEPPQNSSIAADVAKSGGVGLVEGLIGSAGMLGDVNDLLGRGTAWVASKLAGDQPSPEQAQQIEAMRAGPLGLLKPHSSAEIRRPIEQRTGEFYKPQTVAGEYARTIGSFAPAAVGGSGGAASRIIGDIVVPAVASETLARGFGGDLEPYARIAGAALGNVATAGARAVANADRSVAASAVRGVSEDEFRRALGLQETAHRIGVPLSGPEAIGEATHGATKLADLQRVVEASQSGGQVTSRFYADRPGQVDAATRAALDAIAPPSATPSTLGPRAAAAAQGRLDATRRDINTATAPAYRAAEGHLLDGEAFAPIAADPAFQASLRRLRADEVLGPTYRDMPDQSVAVVDAVTKDMRDRGVALSNAANPGFSSQAAGLYGAGATDARSIARDPARGGSAAYDEALTQQAQARRQQLEPLEQGPLGRIAAASTTPAAYAEILPARPLSGGTDEVVAAVMGLERQDPGLPAMLVRQSLADSFDQAGRRIATGENQSVGGRFANAVAGTPEQRANLDAILEAVARPDARDQVSDLFDVLRATSQRRPMGSPTEANRMVNEGLDRIGIPMALASAPASAGSTLFREIGDRLRLGARDRSLSRLADLFTAPDSVERLRELAMQPQTFPMADLLRRQVVQTPAAIEASR